MSDTSIYLDIDNCPYHTGSSYESGWTKYNTKSDYGTVDNKTTLEASDDAATVNLGGKWRMPTHAEWIELIDSCTWNWTTFNGVNGYMVTSKKNGNSIFLPAVSGLGQVVTCGEYWSSSLYTVKPNHACGVLFNPDEVISFLIVYRCEGLSVRPVSK